MMQLPEPVGTVLLLYCTTVLCAQHTHRTVLLLLLLLHLAHTQQNPHLTRPVAFLPDPKLPHIHIKKGQPRRTLLSFAFAENSTPLG